MSESSEEDDDDEEDEDNLNNDNDVVELGADPQLRGLRSVNKIVSLIKSGG